MRIIRASEQVAVPWKNGGGSASAIAGEPEGTGYDGFDWRLSGARVERDGPFSIFPDVDRIMLILSGGRLLLHGLGASPVLLTAQSDPFAFPGDVLVTAETPDGPIRNLNLMIDRRRLSASAGRLAVGMSQDAVLAPPPNGFLLVYGESGSLSAGNEALGPDDTLVTREAVRLGGVGRAIVLRLSPRA